MEGQQSVTVAENRHAVGKILARRHYGHIPGLLGQVNHPQQQGIEAAPGKPCSWTRAAPSNLTL